MVAFSHSQHLVRVKEKSGSWINIEKVKGDLKHETHSVYFMNIQPKPTIAKERGGI